MLASESHLVLGTAGHIDHGKTSLVKALTGIDTDRLKEEQERGITIELGFAHLTLPGGAVVAVVDVPGHERFVRTMVAGAVGIDAALLVVAADEGVMPQTREHLDICELLGLRGGVVALTKCDLVDDELLELCRLELRESLQGTFLAGAPIVPCSARTGQGLPELRAALDDVLSHLYQGSRGRDAAGLFRLPLDRVFALRGFGTVVTGTLWSGSLRVGEELIPLPGPRGTSFGATKVRGLQVHGRQVSEVVAGQRTAVNLSTPREALTRGDTLVRPGTVLPSVLLDVELRYLKVARERLPRRSQLLFHAASAQRLCGVTLLDRQELAPGDSGMAQLQLDEPLVIMPGDRFVLRGFAPQLNFGTTVGGGVVLRTLAARHRRGSAALLTTLNEAAGALLTPSQKPEEVNAATEKLIMLEVERQGTRGADLGRLRMVVPAGEEALRAALRELVQAGELLTPGGPELPGGGEELLYFSRTVLDELSARLLRVLSAHHQKEPRALGLSRETLRTQAGGTPDPLLPRLFQHVLDGLVARGEVVVEREQARLSSHQVAADKKEQALEQRLLAVYEQAGLGPPRADELPALLGKSGGPVSAAAVNAALFALVRSGSLVRVKDLHFFRRHVDELGQRLLRYLGERDQITPAEWKDLVGQSRKFSIPLAEHFDAEKLTLRVGDIRRLRNREGR